MMHARTTTYRHDHLRQGPFAFMGVCAAVAGAALFAAPPANAIPESTITSECEDIGGNYNTAVVKGTDGEYTGTLDKQPPANPGKSSVAPLPPVVVDPGLAPPSNPVAPQPPLIINPGLSPG